MREIYEKQTDQIFRKQFSSGEKKKKIKNKNYLTKNPYNLLCLWKVNSALVLQRIVE